MDRYTIEYVDGDGKPATTECLASNVKAAEGLVWFIADNGEVLVLPVERIVLFFNSAE